MVRALDSAPPASNIQAELAELRAALVGQKRMFSNLRQARPWVLHSSSTAIAHHNLNITWEEVLRLHKQMLVSAHCVRLS